MHLRLIGEQLGEAKIDGLRGEIDPTAVPAIEDEVDHRQHGRRAGRAGDAPVARETGCRQP